MTRAISVPTGPAPVLGVPAPPPLPADLEALLRRLRMPHTRAHAPQVLATAQAQRWDPAEVLRVLLAEEATGRERSALATRRAAAAFPTGKTFDVWQSAASSIPAPTQQALRTLEWIGRAENLVVCGPSGTGKTFLLEALGQLAVEAGRNVAWFSLEDLGLLVRRHRADDTVSKAITRVLRADVIMIDDIGLLPVSGDAAEGLYRLVDAAYEKRSVAVSSNLHPAGFDELMPKTLATATVDRLLHHAHVCQTSGDSVRLSQALAGTGVHPPDPPEPTEPTDPTEPAVTPPGSPTLAALPTIYECSGCGQISPDRRCPDCNLFSRSLGPGGYCPHCDEPVPLATLIDATLDRL